jgi:hypothetical protein
VRHGVLPFEGVNTSGEYYSIDEVAKLFGVSKSAVHGWVRRKRIIPVTEPTRRTNRGPGNGFRFRRAEIDAIRASAKTLRSIKVPKMHGGSDVRFLRAPDESKEALVQLEEESAKLSRAFERDRKRLWKDDD